MMDKVAVVILNYNGKELLQKFLPSVCQFSPEGSVIVADNGSSDDSIIFLQTHYPHVRIIALDQNYGFSGGYNHALQQVSAEYYVLLNSDVEVSPNWVPPVIEWMDKDPTVAAAQPKIKSFHEKNKFEYAGAAGGYIDKFGYPFCRGRIFANIEEDHGQYDDNQEIFWATGACMFVRAQVYHKLGGLDEDFFAHMEEIDLCWRLKNQGHKIYYIASSTVYHVGGGTLSMYHPRKTFLNFRNNLALLYKNLPNDKILPVALTKIALDITAIFFFLIKGHFRSATAAIQANIQFYLHYKFWIKKRAASIENENHQGLLPKSLVIQHFLFRKKYFNQLWK